MWQNKDYTPLLTLLYFNWWKKLNKQNAVSKGNPNYIVCSALNFAFILMFFLRTTLKSSTHVFSIDLKWILVAIMQDHSSWICNYNGNLKQMRKFHIVPNVISIFFKHSPGVIKIIFVEGGVIAYFEVLYQLKLEHNLSARKWLYWDGERNIILQTQVTDPIIFGPLTPKIWLLILHFSC